MSGKKTVQTFGKRQAGNCSGWKLRCSGWSANLDFDLWDHMSHSQQPQDACGKVADRSSGYQQERSVFMRSQCSVRDMRLTPWVTEHPVLLALVIIFHLHAA